MATDLRKKSRKAGRGGWPRLRNIPRNWLHQATGYMDRGELTFRIALETAEVGALLGVLLHWCRGCAATWVLAMISIGTVHTLNWVINANFWALMLFTFPNLRNRGDAATCSYLNAMAARLQRSESISGFALFGSVARGEWHERSDVDIRALRSGGILCWAEANLVLTRERFLAFVSRQPIDIYLADNVHFLERMRQDERPIFLINRDPQLDLMYPGARERRLISLRKQRS